MKSGQDRVVPRLHRSLTESQVERMHHAALRVLDQVGLQVDNQQLVKQLVACDGVRLQDGRICLAPWLVEKHVTAYRDSRGAPVNEENGKRIHLDAGCCASYIVDPDTDEIRPITVKDLVEAVKLIDVLYDESLSGHVPGFPQDVPTTLCALAEYKIGSEYTRWGGKFVAPCPVEGLEYIYEMHQVMGQAFGLPLYVISPLKIAGDSLQSILHFIDRVDRLSVSSMPVMGANAPIHFIGAFTQSIAESIGGFVLLKLIAPDKPVSFGVMAFCLDMKYGSITYGSPEQNLCDWIQIPINAYYGRANVRTRSIRTMAKRPGVQAAAEKGASAIAGALAGSRNFFGAGTLSVDEIFSPEQLIIDREIADYAHRVIQGFKFDEASLSLEAIQECAGTGEFLSHDSTLHNYRDVYWMPRFFEHPMLQDWRVRGEKQVREEARQMVRQKLANYDFELSSEKKRALDTIYERAWKTLL